MYVCTHIVTSVTTCLHLVLQLLYEPWERGLGTCMHSVQYSHMYCIVAVYALCNPWVGRPGFTSCVLLLGCSSTNGISPVLSVCTRKVKPSWLMRPLHIQRPSTVLHNAGAVLHYNDLDYTLWPHPSLHSYTIVMTQGIGCGMETSWFASIIVPKAATSWLSLGESWPAIDLLPPY